MNVDETSEDTVPHLNALAGYQGLLWTAKINEPHRLRENMSECMSVFAAASSKTYMFFPLQ